MSRGKISGKMTYFLASAVAPCLFGGGERHTNCQKDNGKSRRKKGKTDEGGKKILLPKKLKAARKEGRG